MVKFLHFKTMALLLLMIVGASSAWAETSSIEINTTNFTKPNSGSGYAAYDGTRTISGVSIVSSNVMVQSGKLQFKSSSGYLYNSTAMPGNITKITLATVTNFTIYVGTDANPSSNTVTSGSNISGNYTYFKVKCGSSTGTTTTITIEYSTGGGGDTPTTYTVTYDANGGTGTMTDENSPYEKDDDVTLLPNTFTAPDGKIWNSWEVKDASENTITVTNNQFSMPASNVTVKAQWVDDPNAPQYEWVSTSLADLTSTDVFVIVGNSYAMTNNNGTGSAPATFAVTIENNKITSTVPNNIQWTVSGNATNGYTFYPNGSTETWLYCNTTANSSSNNNMRVGTGDRKVFELNNSGYLVTKDDNTTRYLSIYNNADWRGYTGTSNGAVKLSFYKRSSLKTPVATIGTLTPTEIEINAIDEFSIELTAATGLTVADYSVTWESSNSSVLEVADEIYDAKAVGEVTVTVTVTPVDDTNYCEVSKQFNVTVFDPNALGSKTNPYTVAQIREGDANNKTGIWVKGYIVGSWANNTFDPNNLVDSNLALADEYNSTTTIPVELTSGSGLRTNWGPKSNTNNINVAQVLLKGNGTKYFSTDAVKGTSEIEKIAEMVIVSSAGYATYVSDDALDYSNLNVKAYKATVSGTDITFTKVTEVPAGQGVLLQGAGTFEVPVTTGVTAWTDNAFKRGTGAAVASDAGNGLYNYILNSGSQGIGFYKANGQTVAKNRAYLQSTSNAARIAINFDDEATGIANLIANDNDNQVFDLQGRRVAQPQKGLYIVNGRKVVVK